jgi:hypothetical protein
MQIGRSNPTFRFRIKGLELTQKNALTRDRHNSHAGKSLSLQRALFIPEQLAP